MQQDLHQMSSADRFPDIYQHLHHHLHRGIHTRFMISFFCMIVVLPLASAAEPCVAQAAVNSMTQGKSYNFTMAFMTALSNSGPGKFSAGAFFLAIDQLNNITEAKLNGTDHQATFTYVFRDTYNTEKTATRQMVELFCSDVNVSVFVGPDVFCNSAALLATSFDLPYLSCDCNDIHTLRTNMADYQMVNFEPSLAYVAKAIVQVMLSFDWKTFWLISGTGNTTNAWTDTGQELRIQARTHGITFQDVTRVGLNDEYHLGLKKSKPYRKVIEDSRLKTRVYVFLGDYMALVEFLRDLDNAGVTSTGEYVVIAVDDRSVHSSKQSPGYYFHSTEEHGKPITADDLAAFRNVLLLARQDTPVDDFNGFERQVFARNYEAPINLARIPSWWPGKKNHDLREESLYLYDAVMHYGNVVLDLIRCGHDPYNSTLVTERMRNRDLESIQGFKVHISRDGESEGGYVVRSLAYRDGQPLPEMWLVATFSISNSTTSFLRTNNSITWVSGHPPKSEPDCGFDGSLCIQKHAEWKLAAVGVGLVVLVLIVFGIVFVALRHCRYEQRLDRLAWKMEYSAIQLLNDGQLRQMISPGRPRRKVQSRWKNFLNPVDMMGDMEKDRGRQVSLRAAHNIRVGIYKGSHVAVREIMRKHVELNRALKKALLARKEMNHENINRFIGACIEPSRVFIVDHFCSRRSLWDILMDDDSPMDDMFITSLVQDLHKGMNFIHESEFAYHGNLKSSKCLVDNRWVLKIADFGLRQLAVPDCNQLSLEDESYCRKLLWRAPELLKSGTLPPEGTQKGDVYSFGIILYELYGQKGPWGKTHLNCTDIVQRLRTEDHDSQPGLRPFRPDTSVLRVKEGVVSLMQVCWHPDPDSRPDFKNGIRVKLKPIQQGLLKSNIFDNMLAMMEKHAHNLEALVAERTEQLSLEKRMTENLLLRMLPRSVADRLKHGKPVCPEQYEQVSIYFSDIVGFTELSAQSTPMQIVDMLNDLYTCFDSIIENYDVYKVETIGDAYMVVSGLPNRNGLSHAGEVASMSLHLLSAISTVRVRHRPDATLKIRIGIHSGPCCAGVVGLKMPRYCLFGDTVNTASRLETTGDALKIHCSQELKTILDSLGGYHLVERGLIDMKGKGKKLTFFLVGEDRAQRMRRISHERMRLDKAGFPRDRDRRCVSINNLDYRGKIYTMQNGMVRDLCNIQDQQAVPPPHSSGSQHHQLGSQGLDTIRDGPVMSSASSSDSDIVTASVHNTNGIPYYTLPSLSSLASNVSDGQPVSATDRPPSDVTMAASAVGSINSSASTDMTSVSLGAEMSGAVHPSGGLTDRQTSLASPVSVESQGSHQQREFGEPSEMECLLDNSRSKLSPSNRRMSHYRTPETVL